MNHFAIRVEQILILLLSIALLLSNWHTLKAKIRKLRQLLKVYRPRKWKPRSPRDYPSCQSGISLVILKPNSNVVPYAQRKNTRGCKKGISIQGHACPNPKCEYFGIPDHRIHALVGDGKRGKQKHIQYWKYHVVAPQCGEQTLHQSPAHAFVLSQVR